MDLYKMYIEWVTERGSELMCGQAKAWSLVAKLGYVLAHPITRRRRFRQTRTIHMLSNADDSIGGREVL
jgi:hypothetical protein